MSVSPLFFPVEQVDIPQKQKGGVLGQKKGEKGQK